MKTLALIGAGARGMDAYGEEILKRPDRAVFVAVAEPDPYKRSRFAERHRIPEEHCFTCGRELLAQGRLADALLICNQDDQHFDPARTALGLGYHVLLEKPMSNRAEECLVLGHLSEDHPDRLFMICHVLRYTSMFQTLKQLMGEGRIGQLMSIQLSENIGYYHFAHSFVRGNWRRSDESSPLILAKSCHDLDLLVWLADSPCLRVAASGSLSWFKPENAPEGAAARCHDCPHRTRCPYSCYRIYLDPQVWPARVAAPEATPDALASALESGPYGRCVYHCDNSVVDHMSLALEFANQVTATFSLNAFTHGISRTLRVMGSLGEMRASTETREIELHIFGSGVERIELEVVEGGHDGGDSGLIEAFLTALEQGVTDTDGILTSARRSVESHMIAFAAEESRLAARTVDLADFAASLIARMNP